MAFSSTHAPHAASHARSRRGPARLALACLAAVAMLAAPALAEPSDEAEPRVATAEGETVTFSNDVMPVLAKAGCNTGTCHGNLNGKGGFKLSLWGEQPDDDYLTLTRDQLGRRVDRVEPENSLILRKATAEVAHEGGQRFTRDSKEYEILRAWIAAGMPEDPPDTPHVVKLEVTPTEQVLIEPEMSVNITATATFSDGTVRDVTDMAVYETSNLLVDVQPGGRVEAHAPGQSTVQVRFLQERVPVRLTFVPERPGFTWSDPPAYNLVDERVHEHLRQLRMNPSEVAGDETFVRRLYMDLTGAPPTGAEARAFVESTDPDKREELVDALLERPEFNDHWTLMWADLLRNEENVLDRKGVQHLQGWLRQSIADNMPMDEFARQIITARGSTYENPPANFYRALREPKQRSEAVAQVFLGTRLQCAECHNHPFERWKQDDYYSFAANFARVDYTIIENNRRDGLDLNQFNGEQIVYIAREGEVRHPDGRVMQPRYLAAESNIADGERDRLVGLADWLTSPDNRQFARTMVNRIWHRVMGRGIVDPIDDFSSTNPPTNPALLEALTDEFIDSGYDLRRLVRLIATSRTYQLSSKPNDTNADDQTHFSRAIVRRYSAEQMLDAMSSALGVPLRFNGFPIEMRAAEIPGVNFVFRDRNPSPQDRFLQMFGKPERILVCTCERTDDATLEQVFELTSGPAITHMITRENNHLSRWLADDSLDDAAVIGNLYWSVLSRAPTDAELAAMRDHTGEADDRRAAFEDVAWALMNAKTFLLRH